MKLVCAALIFVLLPSIAFAQSGDKIILVSDITPVDMLIAKAASEKSGIPVLALEGGMLDNATKAELQGLDVRTIILVGGPAVIKPETETQLEKSYTVVRLWGTERTGTAMEVARYFWHEGASCVVIADDSKDSDADTEVQAEASEAAASGDCPFLPVPAGRMPAEVLDTIRELKAGEAVFVGRAASREFMTKLAKLKLKEIVGDKGSVEKGLEERRAERAGREGGGLRLLVIAAPHWKHIFGQGGHGGRHTIVRIVSSSDSVPQLTELINARNISDVRVLGQPALAQEIADKLAAQNITVSKVSGEKSSEVARKMLKETLKQWEERRRHAAGNETAARKKIGANLYASLNRTEARLDYLETELASLNASGNVEKAAALQGRIDAAQSQLSAIKTYIENGNYDTARIRLAIISSDVMKLRWLYRVELNISAEKEVREEENTLEEEESEADVSPVESGLAALKEKCNTAAVERLVEKAKALRQSISDVKAAGDYTTASELMVEMREVVQQAKHLSKLCEKYEKIASKHDEAARKRAERAEKMRERAGRMKGDGG